MKACFPLYIPLHPPRSKLYKLEYPLIALLAIVLSDKFIRHVASVKTKCHSEFFGFLLLEVVVLSALNCSRYTYTSRNTKH